MICIITLSISLVVGKVLNSRIFTMSKIKKELKLTFGLKYIFISVLCMLILFMTGEAYTDNDLKSHSIGELLLLGCKDIYRTNRTSSLYIFDVAFSNWVFVFVPIFSCIGFIIAFHSERESGYIRNVLMREKNISYVILKAISCALYSGTVCVLSYAIFALICKMSLQPISRYLNDANIKMLYGTISSHYILRLLGAFLYGMYCGALTFLVMSVFNDKYILLTFPIMINYLYDMTITKMQKKALGSQNYKFFEKIEIFNMKSLLTLRNNKNWWCTCALFVLVYLIAIVIMIINIKTRRDSGDYS